MTSPFLSVITRCYKRPDMLAENVASLEGQADPDYEQLFIVDDVGRGVGWANKQLATTKPTGRYVMVLDDDDMMVDDNAIALMKEAAKNGPHIVIFKAVHSDLGVLPGPAVWQNRPIRGQIGSCDFITRRAVWEKHIEAFGTFACGDFNFLKAIWLDSPTVVWLDRVLAGVQRISRGQPA